MSLFAPRRLRDLCPLSVAVLVAAAVFLPPEQRMGWYGDDLVGLHMMETAPDLATGLELAASWGSPGGWSFKRILGNVSIAFLAWGLGNALASLLVATIHLANGALLFELLRHLRWPGWPAGIAALLFLVSPLSFQPGAWWSTVHTGAGTLLFLVALRAYSAWTVTRAGPGRAIAMVCALLSLLFYELWLSGWLSFFALEICRRRLAAGDADAPPEWSVATMQALRATLPMLAPYATYVALYLSASIWTDHVHSPVLSIERVLRTGASIHFRLVHQAWVVPWHDALTEGLRRLPTAWSALWIVAGVVAVKCALGSASSPAAAPAPEARPGGITGLPVAESLVFAYGLLLGSRLVFILLGGVSLHSRHSYGASIAVAIAAVAACSLIIRRLDGSRVRRRAGLAAGVAAIGVLTLVQTGLAHNAAEITRWEARTLDTIRAALRDSPAVSDVLIVGRPNRWTGEVPYGTVLLYDFLYPEIDRHLATEATVDGQTIDARLVDGTRRSFASRSTLAWTWRNAVLEPLPTAAWRQAPRRP